MKQFLLLSSIAILIWTKAYTQHDIMIYDSYEEMLNDFQSKQSSDDQIQVINFWAIWCAPCVKELPYFEELRKQYSGDQLAITLVSLDFVNTIEKRLLPLLEKKNLQNNVVVLGDTKAHIWIDKVDTNWDGSIPATLFVKGNQQKFVAREFHSTQEIIEELQSLLH